LVIGKRQNYKNYLVINKKLMQTEMNSYPSGCAPEYTGVLKYECNGNEMATG